MKTILLLDNDETSLERTKELLKENGYDVTAISDVSRIYTLYSELLPEITILKSSKEIVQSICKEIHDMDNGQIPNIIVYTTKDDDHYEDCERYQFHTVPTKEDVFIDKIKTILNTL